MAAPTPWKKRWIMTISTPRVKPSEKVKEVNTASPARKTRRWPTMSPSRPKVSMVMARDRA